MSLSDLDNPHIADYMALVESGSVPCCREQALLMGMVRRVFAEEDIRLDAELLERYMEYEKYFPFRLFPWERFLFALHNCVFDAEGLPRWAELFVFVGRGSGKNGYLAFENFCLLSPAHAVRQYPIDACANSERQATATFEYLHDLLENPVKPEYAKSLRKHFRWNLTEVECRDTGSVYRYYTSSPKTKDGLKSGKVDFDEVHVYEDRKNIMVFETGLGKKPEPRMTFTTTNGEVDGGVLDEMLEQAADVLSGESPDMGYLPFVCRLDDEKEVHDEAMWVKANPSYGYLPPLRAEMRREYEKYRRSPGQNSQFMTKRMNLRALPEEMVVARWEDIKAAQRATPALAHKSCIIGIDYAKASDMVAAVFLFRSGEERYVVHHSWFCERSADRDRIKRIDDFRRMPELVTFVDDVEIHADLVTGWIERTRRENHYNAIMVAMDSYRFEFMRAPLEALGFDPKDKAQVKLVRPSDLMLVQGKVDSMFANRRIAWGEDDRVMGWYTNNAKLVPGPNGNFKFDKIEPRSRKTDGFMALVAAMTCENELPAGAPVVLPVLAY